MKIQIFTRNFIGKISNFDIKTLSTIGGAEVYLMQLIKAVKKKYPKAEIVVYQIGDEEEGLSNDLFTLKYIKLNKLEKYIFPISLSFKFKKFIEKDSIKIFNYPNYAAFLKKQEKSIGIFHGVEWDTNLKDYVYREIKYRYRSLSGFIIAPLKYLYFRGFVPFCVKRGIKKMDRAISVDNNIFNYFKDKTCKEKIKVIYNCVDLDVFSNEVNSYKKSGILNILVPRNLNVARGVFLLPEIAKLLMEKKIDFRINIVGTGPLKSYLENEIKKNNLEKQVNLLGHISDRNEMANLYTNSDIILIPTVFSEGTSLSALEALACNKVVMMTDVGGLSEIGMDGISKIKVDPNPKDIAEKIVNVVNDKKLYKKLVDNSRKCVAENFSYEQWSEKWINIIEEVNS